MATENSLETLAPRQERAWLFPPGRSPNPGGRPKGLATLVKEHTRDGAELVEFMVKVFRNKRQPLRYRLEAVAWLADRGFGKALQQMELSGPDGAPIPLALVDQVLADADA